MIGVLAVVVPAVGADVARAQETEWLHQFSTPAFGAGAAGVAVDSSGAYVVGSTWGDLPGQSNAGLIDTFVRKYDTAGNELWTRQFGTLDYDVAYGVVVDATGVYVVGSTTGTLPGQLSAGSDDAFVRKYDTAGNELWTRQFGSEGLDQASAVTADATGVYVVGTTEGTLPGQSSAGSFDAFIRKYDRKGVELWTRQFGDSSGDFALGAGADATGIYVVGEWGTIIPVNGADAFIRKYDSRGTELWSRQFASSASYDLAFDVAASKQGVYVVGYIYGALPGQTSAGDWDAWIRKYDSGGREIWTRQFGTSGFDRARGVAADSTGVYVTGTVFGDFAGQTSAGLHDAVVAAFGHDGSQSWVRLLGTGIGDEGTSVALDASGVYTVGTFLSLSDAFVAKLTKGTVKA
jgi:hypothetical protein